MKQYTFEDTDKMKEICLELEQDLESGFTKICEPNSDYDKTVDLVDQLMEVCEMHERSNLNLALSGGLKTVL